MLHLHKVLSDEHNVHVILLAEYFAVNFHLTQFRLLRLSFEQSSIHSYQAFSFFEFLYDYIYQLISYLTTRAFSIVGIIELSYVLCHAENSRDLNRTLVIYLKS